MVYRGKPSAGCENCRKAKKRCGLELPSCSRCVKLKKQCTGYRDTTQLQIQDETSSVKKKAERQKAKSQSQFQVQQRPAKTETAFGMLTPAASSSEASTPYNDPFDFELDDDMLVDIVSDGTTYGDGDMAMTKFFATLKSKPEDVATTYFMNQFTSPTHWVFMREFMQLPDYKIDPCLELAVKACGMAALDNVQGVVMGRDYARSMYVQALSLLNDALRDPVRCRTDESLIAVTMLGYFENLTCEGRTSIQSWKAHISGATQLLKLRGKEQFKTRVGRLLFRETRASIMIHCIWDDLRPPPFLWDFQEELLKHQEDRALTKPIDDVTEVCFDFATMKADMVTRKITDQQAAELASELERRFIQWQIETTANHEKWRYYEIEVEDSEHVWDGRVHSYTGHPAPTMWNTYRCMRIMLSRVQEELCRKFGFSEAERDEQMQYFRRTRRQLTDEICATIPVALGHSSPAYSSACVLITAYGSIWPLFFAGTCALERVGPGAIPILMGQPVKPGQASSAAAAQAKWILDRLEYISKNVGLRWAEGVMATMRGDFQASLSKTEEEEELDNYRADRAPWIRAIEDAHRGPRYLIETPSPLSDALTEEMKLNEKPIWFNREERQQNLTIYD